MQLCSEGFISQSLVTVSNEHGLFEIDNNIGSFDSNFQRRR